MMHCSKQLVFSATNLMNPAEAGTMFAEERARVISAEYPGSMTISVGVVKVPTNRRFRIENVFAGVGENYSYVRKSYSPINTIRFFGSQVNDLGSLLAPISEAMIASTALKFNGVVVPSLASASGLILSDADADKWPTNKLEFNNDPATLVFPYAPRFQNPPDAFGGSVFDGLRFIGAVSFIDTANPDFQIPLPDAVRYVLVFLSSVAPTPISSYRSTASNISVVANLSFDIAETEV